jgi:hypothetical protein
MSHHFSQDKAVKKLEMGKISLFRLFSGQDFFKSLKANFQPGHLLSKQHLEKFA